jgi:hypothetical protein
MPTREAIVPTTKDLRRTVALLVAAFALAFFLVGAGFDASEGIDHYYAAQHLIRTGVLGIKDAQGDTFDTAPNGLMYDVHEIGNMLFMLPWVALGDGLTAILGRHLPLDRQDRLTMFLVCLNAPLAIAAMCGALVWILTYCFGVASRIAFTAALAFGFGSMAFEYSKVLFDGVAASALVMMALACGFSYGRDSRVGWVPLAGLFLALAFITRTTAALFVPALAAYMAVRTKGDRRAVAQVLLLFGLPLMAAIAWQAYYNELRTGVFWLFPMMTPRRTLGLSTFQHGNFLVGFLGVLLSPGKSIFLYSPVLILALPGWKAMFTRFRAEAWTLLGFVLPYYLLHCALHVWAGHAGWGPRYFLLVLAPLFLPAAFWVREASARGRRLWALVLLWGVTVQVAAVWNDWQYRWTLEVMAGNSPDDITWKPRLAPWVDAIENVGRNVQRMAGWRAADVIPGANPLHVQAANSVNIWWLNTPLGGSARIGLFAAILVLFLLDLVLWRNVSRKCGETEPAAKGHPAALHQAGYRT